MAPDDPSLGYLSGGGDVGRHLLVQPSADSALGTPPHWPAALHDTLRITLYSEFPHIVYWGPDFLTFWNDAASEFFKAQHPQRLGQPLAQVQPDVMRTLRPLLQQVMDSGQAVIRRDFQLLYVRDDYTEEFYEFFSYSPLLDTAGRVQGVIAPIFDTTARVISQRRMALLAGLATGTRGARTLQAYCAALQACLQAHPYDLPLAALYLGDADDASCPAQLAASSPPNLRWPARLAAPAAEGGQRDALSLLPLLPLRELMPDPPAIAWDRAPEQLAVLPVLEPGTGRRAAHLLCALNPYKRLDADYQTFLTLVAAQVGQGLADTLATEQAADRALAEIARLTRLNTLGELATSIAHEVNQPLAAMVIDANAAQRWLAADPPDLNEVAAAARRIVRNGEHAGSVLARTRRFLQRTPGERQPIDLVAVAWESLQIIAGRARREGIAMRARLARDLPRARADRTQIQQVIINLLLNAIEAMPACAAAREIRLDVERSSSPPGIRVAVRDSGCGIEAGQAARLFEAFYSTKPDGLGFGLSISRSIVEAHGGLIWSEPALPQGAAFAFVLPVEDDEG